MVSFRLDDKVVVISGAVGLLGKSFCLNVAKANAVVILADINEKEGIKLEQEINNKYSKEIAKFWNTDITDLHSIKNLITFILQKYGKIDALVNSAYPHNKNYGRIFEDVTYKDFCNNINIHLGGYFLTTQQVATTMMQQNSGNIINIASIYGSAAPRFEIYKETNITMPVEYAAIKGAIINLTRYLASYLGKWNIRVNSISPGGVYDNQPKGFVKKYSQKVLLEDRMANTDDVTGVLMFLLSDASKYMTGQDIIVDGGWTI